MDVKRTILLLEKATIVGIDDEILQELICETDLTRRTIVGIINLFDNEPDIKDSFIRKLLDKDFYTRKNMVSLANEKILDVIPASYFEDESFLDEAGIDTLPPEFVCGDKTIERFNIMPQIRHIAAYAFAGCEKLEDIFFTDNLKSIGEYAFENCTNLMLEDLPESVEFIGTGIFKNCTAMYQFKSPQGLKGIPAEAFNGCYSLSVFYSNVNDLRLGDKAFSGCSSLEELKATIHEVGENTFENCSQLEQITLSSAVIKRMGFLGCRNLKKINFVNSAPQLIDKHSFSGCCGIEEINVDGYVYELTGNPGYNELRKNFKIIYDAEGKRVVSAKINPSRKTENITVLSL